MAPFVLRGATAFSSLVLVIISTATLYMTGNAFHLIAHSFPQNKYVWHGPLGVIRDDWPNTHMVTMTYDSTTENLIFVAAGSSALAGLFGILRAGIQESRRRMTVDGKDPAPSALVSYGSSLLTSFAFLFSIVSVIYINALRLSVREKTCQWTIGETHDAVFTCTRELATCHILQYLGEREQGPRIKACRRLRDSRGMMPLLAVGALVLGAGYMWQAWARMRDNKALRWNIDEKTRRLEHEE